MAERIDRMVRTPLARRIKADQTLNDVNCLPLFNKDQDEAIVQGSAEGRFPISRRSASERGPRLCATRRRY